MPGRYRMTNNPFEEITAKLDELTAVVRALKAPTPPPPRQEFGGVSLAMAITGLSRKSIYQLTYTRAIPHTKVRSRLRFTAKELEAWMEAGRRPMAAETAIERMTRKSK